MNKNSSPDINVITTSADLEAYCGALRSKPFISVDTEFMRERTYWPILCLIQAAAEGVEAIIDPMADLDLAPFLEILADEKIVKVFHAARQDMEIFVKLMDAVPAPIFDTQVAAMACGYGDQVGYEPLMRGLLGAQIDKGSRFTDWSRRPLSPAQLSYALSDVTHLRDAYPLLLEKLSESNRHSWVEEEMAAFADRSLYEVQPEDAWARLKLRGVRPNEIGVIMALAEWREREAQERDQPRSRILKDDAIFELARLKPKSADAMARARALPKGTERSKLGNILLDTIKVGLAIPESELPEMEKPGRVAPPPAEVVELLKVLLKRQCETYDVAPKLIASTNDLERLARDQKADIPAMHGWRREVFGEPALRLMAGKIGMRLNRRKIEIFDL
ncbi:MAG: ribonuclease D [Pseudomonadota bacterium]